MNIPTCIFCQGKLNPRGRITDDNFSQFIYYCHQCDAMQSYTENGSIIEFNFDVLTANNYSYWVRFDAMQSHLRIIQNYDRGKCDVAPQASRVVLETKLQSFPAWLAPGKLSEHRIQTLKVFS